MNPILGMLIGGGMGQIFGGMNDQRQLNQQGALNEQQAQIQKQLTNFNMKKQLELWEKTNYGAQIEQLKKAGLNPSLIYGMKGGGGATTAVAPGSVAGGQATQGGGGEALTMAGLGMESAARTALLKAQKENIEADTANKKMDTTKKDQEQYSIGLDNAMKSYLQSTDEDGQESEGGIHNTMAGKKTQEELKQIRINNKFQMDENDRRELMNSAVMNEIGEKISLMIKQGMKEEQIYRNLYKEGLLLDAEIEWNKLELKEGNVGKFITNVIKMALKPR